MMAAPDVRNGASGGRIVVRGKSAAGGCMTFACSQPPRIHARRFPRNFVWGVATAAPQIEGAAFADGKGESIWDRFCREPGRVRNGDTLDVACDHYHRFPEDCALMRSLGVKHYRLSIAWPRIYPKGEGAVNEPGLEFYRRLLRELRRNGITPWVTLFHWDLPQALEEQGGWRTRRVVDAFARYAQTVVREFSGEVKHWITLNEIRCFTELAYGGGDKAPGADEPPAVLNQIYHHALLCHGEAVQAVRRLGGRGAKVGLTDNLDISVPQTETPEDIAAARAWFVDHNAHILEPIHTGRYSAAYLRRCGKARPKVLAGDMALIAQSTDFLGLNIYTGWMVRRALGGRGRYEELPFPADFPRASSPWQHLIPESIYWGCRFAAEVYGAKAIYITENGCGYDLEKEEKGEVQDLHRITILRSYLRELRRAVNDGVPAKGYFLWSLFDNFEWQDGYTRRFGIVRTDYRTQRRIPKASARWYREVMKANAVL